MWHAYTISKGCSPAIPPPIASENRHGCQGENRHPCNFWGSCPAGSNNDAAFSESSTSLVKHRSHKRPALMFDILFLITYEEQNIKKARKLGSFSLLITINIRHFFKFSR